MAVHGGSDIVNDKLFIALDVSDHNSYSGAGSTWTDMIGNHNGTKTGSPTYANDGVADYFSFDATTEYFDLSNTLTDFTESAGKSCCVWIMNGGNSAEARIVNSGYSGTGGNGATGFAIGVTGSGTANQPFSFFRNSSGGALKQNFGDVMNTTDWYHLAVTVGSTGKNYQNGVLKSTISNAGAPSTSITGNTTAKIATFWGNPGSFSFIGKIACVQFYTKELTEAEVLQNFNAQKVRFGL